MNRTLSFLFASWLATTVVAQGDVSFRIGTWNLEFLGAEGNYRNNLPPRTDADYAAIGKKIVDLGVAVMAVQEINDEATLRKVAAGAGSTWQVLLGTSGGWDDGKTAQSIGFLYDRTTVDLLSAEELLVLPRTFEGQPIFHRVPVTACFRHRASGCDFRAVTVHLKAGQKAQDEQKRRGESLALAKWLDELRSNPAEDSDVVVLGDFNSTYGTDPERNFEATQQRRYLEHKVSTPTIMHFPEPIDQVVVSTLFLELRADSLLVDNDCDGMAREVWRQCYSDHFPVTVTIAAHSDDDASSTFCRGAPEQALPRLREVAPPTPPAPIVIRSDNWPPKIGQMIRVLATNKLHEGRLLRDVPQGPGGWVVLDVNGQTVAVPWSQVYSLVVQ